MYETIKRLMDRAGHTPKSLSDRIGVKIGSVHFWLNRGENNKLPRPAHLRALIDDARLAPFEEVTVWREFAQYDQERG